MKQRLFIFSFRCGFALIVAAAWYAAVAVAMDWETAAEIATCRRHAGYEKLAARASDLLREHGIHSILMYFAERDKNGIEAVGVNPHEAGRWGLYVDIRDSAKARGLVASAIRHGLHVTLSTNGPDATPEVTATPK
jgi:hypothetical protein